MEETCVCGYHYVPEWNRDSSKFDEGTTEFIKITGSTFKIKEKYHYPESKEVNLVACPECFTVKISKY